MKIICKLQRPISTNDPARPWLLYDEKRKIEQQIPEAEITPFMLNRMGDDLKAYWQCELRRGRIEFIRRVAAQNW